MVVELGGLHRYDGEGSAVQFLRCYCRLAERKRVAGVLKPSRCSSAIEHRSSVLPCVAGKTGEEVTPDTAAETQTSELQLRQEGERTRSPCCFAYRERGEKKELTPIVTTPLRLITVVRRSRQKRGEENPIAVAFLASRARCLSITAGEERADGVHGYCLPPLRHLEAETMVLSFADEVRRQEKEQGRALSPSTPLPPPGPLRYRSVLPRASRRQGRSHAGHRRRGPKRLTFSLRREERELALLAALRNGEKKIHRRCLPCLNELVCSEHHRRREREQTGVHWLACLPPLRPLEAETMVLKLADEVRRREKNRGEGTVAVGRIPPPGRFATDGEGSAVQFLRCYCRLAERKRVAGVLKPSRCSSAIEHRSSVLPCVAGKTGEEVTPDTAAETQTSELQLRQEGERTRSPCCFAYRERGEKKELTPIVTTPLRLITVVRRSRQKRGEENPIAVAFLASRARCLSITAGEERADGVHGYCLPPLRHLEAETMVLSFADEVRRQEKEQGRALSPSTPLPPPGPLRYRRRRERRSVPPLLLPLGRTEEGGGGVEAVKVFLRH
nr:hypothetical protein Iba_chr12aCG10490 [Ipomoea batatas]